MSAGLPIRSVAVIGGGLVARVAALAFARALPGAQVELVTTPVPPDALADHLPRLWPTAAPLLAMLGLDERELIARGHAAPVLARRHAGWSRTGTPWLCPEGEAMRVPGVGLLHQRWLHAGGRMPFHDLFPAAALAMAGRLSLDALARPALAAADLTLALDPGRFGALIAEGCRRAGVTIGSGPLSAAQPGPDGGWRAVRLADGREIGADLFVWAGGAPLPGEQWLDWSASLPADRLVLAAERSMALLDDHRADDHGWRAQWMHPGGGVAAVAFNAAAGPSPSTPDPARALVLGPGRAARGWSGNLLRLGDAAAQLGPLGLAGFTLAAHQLLLALDLLPGRDMAPVLVAEYNRRAGLRADHLRDFLAAHYLGGGRRTGPFWAGLTGQEAPPTLAALLAQFRRRGHLPHRDEDSVPADAWRAVLLGQGIRPAVPDPIVAGIDRAVDRRALADAARSLAGAVAGRPISS